MIMGIWGPDEQIEYFMRPTECVDAEAAAKLTQ